MSATDWPCPLPGHGGWSASRKSTVEFGGAGALVWGTVAATASGKGGREPVVLVNVELGPTEETEGGQTVTSDRPRQLLVSVEEAGRILGIGRATVYGLIAGGLICPVHIGRLCRVPVAELDEFVARLRVQQRP